MIMMITSWPFGRHAPCVELWQALVAVLPALAVAAQIGGPGANTWKPPMSVNDCSQILYLWLCTPCTNLSH